MGGPRVCESVSGGIDRAGGGEHGEADPGEADHVVSVPEVPEDADL